MTEKVECEVFLAMDEDENWYVGKDAESVVSDLSSDGGVCMRTVKVTVKMAPPVLDEVEVDVPDDAGTTTQVEAQAAE